MVGSERHGGICEKDAQRPLPFEGIEGGLPKGGGGQQHVLSERAFQPRQEFLDHGLGVGGPIAQFRRVG